MFKQDKFYIKAQLINYYSHRAVKQQGFALPTAMVCGLIILLLGGTLLLRSQNDQTTALMQQAGDSSLNLAEGGVTRIQAFIEVNRSIATYSLTDWLNATTTMSTLLSNCGSLTTTQLASFATAATTWQDMDPQNPARGQFRLVNYTYTADDPTQPHSAPGRGVLEVEGRLQNQQSTNRLRITIPVLEGDVTGTPIPGVWLTQGGTENNPIQANALLNDCSVSLNTVGTTGTDPATGQPYQARYTNMRFPTLPTIPSVIPNSLPINTSENITLPCLSQPCQGRTNPNSVDVPTYQVIRGQAQPVYEYDVDSLTIQNNTSITITPGTRVRFYLRGNINRGGDIIHDCRNGACDPTNFQIFGYGSSGNIICLNGNDRIDAVVLAPAYTLGLVGTGGGQDNYRGAIWTYEWSNDRGCGPTTNTVTVTQTANWDSLGLLPENLPPKLAPASSWERVVIAQQP